MLQSGAVHSFVPMGQPRSVSPSLSPGSWSSLRDVHGHPDMFGTRYLTSFGPGTGSCGPGGGFNGNGVLASQYCY